MDAKKAAGYYARRVAERATELEPSPRAARSTEYERA